MLIIRVKGTVPHEKMEKIRSNIKRQISEGLIVHDDSIEITIVDDMCPECGSENIEEITFTSDNADTYSIIKCNRCNYSSDIKWPTPIQAHYMLKK